MTQKEILAELEKMSTEERLEVIEAATRLLRSDLGRRGGPTSGKDIEEHLRTAAELMRSEYESDNELTAFWGS